MSASNRARRAALAAVATTALSLLSGSVLAQAKGEIRIAHVYSRTGPLEAYGKQTQTGLMMGLDYATGGTMTVAGQQYRVSAGDGIQVPSGVEHSFHAAATTKAIQFYTPGGPEQRFKGQRQGVF